MSRDKDTANHDDEVFDPPTPDNFEYKREFFPLFFSKPSPAEERQLVRIKKNIIREYYQRDRQSKHRIHYSTPLTYGVTFGELAMHICVCKYNQRMRKKKIGRVKTIH